MRERFPDIVEKGRLQRHDLASPPGDTYGAFYLKVPGKDGALLFVMVGDGKDWFLGGPAWEHVSAHVIGDDGRAAKRTPTWEEMCWLKSLFWDDEECVVQFHPPRSRYVDTHAGTLHLWRAVGVAFPMPPAECV